MGGFLWALLGVLIWLGLATPLASLVLAYPQDEAFLFATLYFHFFLFALLFGPLMVYAMMRPLGFILRFYASRGLKGILPIFFLIGLPAVMSVPIWMIETPAGPAPWEFNMQTLHQARPELADNTGKQQSLIQIYSSLKDIELQERLAHELQREDRDERGFTDCLILRDVTPEDQCVAAELRLERLMHELLSNPANRSLTYYAYRAGFPVWTMVFLVGLMTILFYGLAHRPLARAALAKNGKRSLEFQLYHLVGFVFLIGLWFFVRFLYQVTTGQIYAIGVTGSDYGDIRLGIFLWGFVILVAVGWLTIAFLRAQSEVGRWLVPSLATVVTGAIGFALSSDLIQETLLTYFGVRATWNSLSILAIVLLFAIVAPLMGRIANPDDGTEEPPAPA